MTQPDSELTAEDAKLVTLARGARGRNSAPEGAAVRDETGRTYSASTVSLEGLSISAVGLAVAQAASSGSRGLEAVVIIRSQAELTDDDRAQVIALGGPGVPVIVASPAGQVLLTETTWSVDDGS
jgi:hypothetical protein